LAFFAAQKEFFPFLKSFPALELVVMQTFPV